MNIADIKALAAQAAAVAPDMNEAVKGGSGARLLPAGYAFGRMVEYVELGHQPQEFNGKAKDPALEVQLGFALWGQGYQNEDGSPYITRLYPFAISRNEKARAYLLFKLLNWTGTKKHFAELLDEPILVKIEHVAKSKTDSTIVSRIDLKGFLPPLDPVGKQPYPIPPATADMFRVFLWDFPTKEGWDSLYVEGKFDDGASKNRVQETIISALNFEGSPIQQLLYGASLPTLPTAATAPALPATPSLPPGAGYAPAFSAPPVAAVPVAPATVPEVPVQVPLAQPVAAAVPNVSVGIPAMPVPPIAAATVSTQPSSPTSTTSPSSPALPSMPAMPAIPTIPA